MTRHQYGISAFVTQTSFCEGSSGDLARPRLYSQARHSTTIPYFSGRRYFLAAYAAHGGCAAKTLPSHTIPPATQATSHAIQGWQVFCKPTELPLSPERLPSLLSHLAVTHLSGIVSGSKNMHRIKAIH